MDRLLHYPQRVPQPSKFAHPLGTVVFCVHCFQTIGTESTITSRESLLANHNCAESLLAKQPAAPPPYN